MFVLKLSGIQNLLHSVLFLKQQRMSYNFKEISNSNFSPVWSKSLYKLFFKRLEFTD